MGAPRQNHAATQLLATILFVLLSAASPARAELYQFTITGHVLWSIPSQPQPGDPAIIRYLADTTDTFPEDPLYGEYPCLSHEIEFPHDTFRAIVPGATKLYVVRGQVGDGVAISDTVATSKVGYFSRMGLGFPPGSFLNDSLPLSVDFQNVNFARLELHTAPNVKVAVALTSYDAVRVPGPSSFICFLVLTLITCAMRTIQREVDAFTRLAP